MKTITVNVTQEHIDKGEVNSVYNCPIALALSELGPEYSYAVNPSTLRNIHNEWVADLPLGAVYFIREYDDLLTVYPFSFEVELP